MRPRPGGVLVCAQRADANGKTHAVSIQLAGVSKSAEPVAEGLFNISWERSMSVAVQYVVRPNPGTDPAKITELAKEGAALWRKHGGKVTYWAVAVGEVGNRVLSITFENFAAYGAAVDKMGEDKEVRAWQEGGLHYMGAF